MKWRESSNRMKNKKFSLELPKAVIDGRTLPSDTKVPTDMVHGLYVMRLVEEGVPVEKAFDLVIDGILQPN